jgi:hypothetical protein
LQGHQRRDFVLAGTMLGLTQYFYEGARLLMPALVIGWLIIGLIFWRWDWKRHWCDLLLMLLTAMLVAAPMYLALFGQESSLTTRLNANSLGSDYWRELFRRPDWLQELWRNRLQSPFLHYVHLPDQSAYYYGGATPMILWYLVPAFFLGLFQLVWRWSKPGGSLPILWILLTILGNSLIAANYWTARHVTAFPAVALTIAVGLRYTIPLLWRWGNQRWQPALAGAAAFLLFLPQMIYYFGPHLELYRYQTSLPNDYVDAIHRAYELPRDVQSFIVTDDYVYAPHFDILYRYWGVNLNIQVLQPPQMTQDFLSALPRDVNYAFFIEQSDTPSVSALNQVFRVDAPQFSPHNLPQERQFILYYAHAE